MTLSPGVDTTTVYVHTVSDILSGGVIRYILCQYSGVCVCECVQDILTVTCYPAMYIPAMYLLCTYMHNSTYISSFIDSCY